jgi:hypothetical protein
MNGLAAPPPPPPPPPFPHPFPHGGMFPMIWPQQSPTVYVLPESGRTVDIANILSNPKYLAILLAPVAVGYLASPADKKLMGAAIGFAAGAGLILMTLSPN